MQLATLKDVAGEIALSYRDVLDVDLGAVGVQACQERSLAASALACSMDIG